MKKKIISSFLIFTICIYAFSFTCFAESSFIPFNMSANSINGGGVYAYNAIDAVKAKIASDSSLDYLRGCLDWDYEYFIVVRGFYLWGSWRDVPIVLINKERLQLNANQSVIQCQSFTYSNGVVDSVSINFANYIDFVDNGSGGFYVDNPWVSGYYNCSLDYSLDSVPCLVYCRTPIYCNGQQVVYYDEQIFIPTYPIDTLDGDPMGYINGDGSSHNGHPGPLTNSSIGNAPLHNYHSQPNISTNTSNYDDSNPLHNLLAKIINNLKSIGESISDLWGALSTLSQNIGNGFANLYNGLSGLLSNFFANIQGYFDYLFAPVDSSGISTAIQDMAVMETANNIMGLGSSFKDNINNLTDKNSLYITMDFRNSPAPFSQMGLYVFDFSLLDNYKNVWQPILLMLLYITLGLNIFYSLPDIVQGFSGGESID